MLSRLGLRAFRRFLNCRRPIALICLFSGGGTVLGQGLDHFAWGPLPTSVTEGQAFSSLVQAVDLSGNILTNFNGSAILTAVVPNAQPTLLITEIETINTERVELSNVSTNSVDISGWRVIFYDAASWPTPKVSFTIPPGIMCPGLGVFQVRDYGPYPGVYPTFYSGVGLIWSDATVNNQVAVLVLDAQGKAVDFFCAVDAFSPLIRVPISIGNELWSGPPVPPNTNPGLTYQRGHHSNSHTATDWSALPNTVGNLNSGLGLPFIEAPTISAVIPSSVVFSNGLWSGQLVVTVVGSNAILHADDGLGHAGDSTAFSILGLPQFTLQVPHAAFKATAGLVGQGTITLAQPLLTNLVVSLFSSMTNQIIVPPNATLAAGATNVTFNVTNLDDGLTEGPQVANIVALAPGFSAATDVVTNYDRPPVLLSLSLPTSVAENSGWVGTAQIQSSVHVSRDVAVRLSSSATNRLVVPDFVVLPAGQSAVNFGFSVLDNSLLDGNLLVTVAATVPGWTAAQAQTLVVENENTNLVVSLPSQISAGSGTLAGAGRLQIFGLPTTNVSVNLTSSVPNRLQVPSRVIIPTGQTSAVFSVVAPNSAIPASNQTVVITTTAPGFRPASSTIAVIDNHVDRFSFAALPAAQTAGQPFQVTVSALNLSGTSTPGYTNLINLRANGFEGAAAVSPTVIGPFTNGLWSGPITIPNPNRGLILTADDGQGHTGASTQFDVVADQVINLPVADLAYDALRGKLLAGVVTNPTATAQSVVPIDPPTGNLGAPIPIGADPSLLALSDDFSYLYTALEVNSTGGVVRIDLNSQSVDLRFALGTSNIYGQSVNYTEDMKVQPGHPHTLIATTKIQYAYNQFMAVYDDGVRRPTLEYPVYYVRTYHIAFGDSPTNFYITKPDGLWLNAITPSGPTFIKEIAGPQYGADVKFSGGLLYSTLGQVFNTNDFRLVGQFPTSGMVIPNSEQGRIYFLSQNGALTSFQAFDPMTFRLVASLALPNVSGQPSSFVQCGSNTFAFRTTGGQVHIFDTSFLYNNPVADLGLSLTTSPPQPVVGSNLVYSFTISNSGPATSYGVAFTNQLPFWSSFVSATSTVGVCSYASGTVWCTLRELTNGAVATVTITIQPSAAGLHFSTAEVDALNLDPSQTNNALTDVRQVLPSPVGGVLSPFSMPNNDIGYDPASQRIWVSVPPTSSTQASNCLLNFDPVTGQVGAALPIGRQPNQLAVAAEGQTLYVGLDGDTAVRQLDTVSQTLYAPFLLGSNIVAYHMAVMPGSPQTLAVSTLNELAVSHTGVFLYDNGVPRSTSVIADCIEFSQDGSLLYSSDGAAGLFSINAVTASGLSRTSSVALDYRFSAEMGVAGQNAYFASGYQVSLPGFNITQPFPTVAYAPIICVDEPANRVFFVFSDSQNRFLQQFNLTSHILEASLTLPPLLANPTHLLRWGDDGLAFRDPSNQVFLARISLLPPVPPPQPLPRLAVSQTVSPGTGQVGSNVTYTLIVTNPESFDAQTVLLTDVLPHGATFVSGYTPQGSVTQDQNGIEFSLGTLPHGSAVTLSLVASLGMAGLNLNSNAVTAGGLALTNSASTSVLWQWANFGGPLQLTNEINLPVADVGYDSASRQIYASVIDAGGPLSNRLVSVDATTGALGLSIPLPVTPGLVAVSDDGGFVYVVQNGSNGIARVNVATQAVDLQFPVGTPDTAPPGGWITEDMAVMPGAPHTLAVARGGGYANYSSGVAIFDDGVKRPSSIDTQTGTSFYRVKFASATNLYATYPGGFQILAVTPAGITNTPPITNAFAEDFALDSGLVFTASGKVFDPVAGMQLGVLPANGVPEPDLANARVYYLSTYGNGPWNWWLTLRADDPNTYKELFSVAVPPITGAATRLKKLDPNGLAGVTDANRLFLFHVGLVAAPLADLSISQTASPNPIAPGGVLTYSSTIRNGGPWTATDVVVSNPLPVGVSFISAAASPGTCTFTNGSVLCAAGTLTNGGSASLTIRVTPTTGPGTLTNSVFVTANESDPIFSNNTASVQTTVLPPPVITVPDAAVVSRSTPTSIGFVFTLSARSTASVSIGYTTTDGTALAGQDYQATNGVFTIPSGVLSSRLTLPIINGTTRLQTNRFFYLDLLSATNASLLRTQVVANIISGGYPLVSISNATVVAGASATKALFNIVLNATSSVPVTVQYQTVDGSAIAGSDYEERHGGLVFAPGAQNVTLPVPVFANPSWAPSKSFSVVLSQPANAEIVLDTALGTILNTNPVPPLVVITPPRSQTVPQGSSAGFSVVATGNPLPLSYQWQFDGTNLPGATGTALTLTNVQPNNAGNYAVTVGNAANNFTNVSAGLKVLALLNWFSMGSSLVLTWPTPYVLQSSTNIAGPYLDVSGAASPYTNWIGSEPERFFRLRAGANGSLSMSLSADEVLVLNVSGLAGYNYSIQVSTNLNNWAALQTNAAPFRFITSHTNGLPMLFFRSLFLR